MESKMRMITMGFAVFIALFGIIEVEAAETQKRSEVINSTTAKLAALLDEKMSKLRHLLETTQVPDDVKERIKQKIQEEIEKSHKELDRLRDTKYGPALLQKMDDFGNNLIKLTEQAS